MIELSLAEVAAVVGAAGAPPGRVTGAVRIDSREVGPGDLFVALPGEHADGHRFAAAAVAAGAVGALVSRPATDRDLLVGDPLAGLQALARHVFCRDQPTTIGITGSSGKTSTKDLVAQVLAGFGPTLAPPGSFNNEIGLPLTATGRQPETAYAVLEYSARGVGHIAFLCQIVPPHVAVVLNVGSAHLGTFGSVAAIAAAKSELVAAATRLAVLNADDPVVAGMAQRARGEVVTFGSRAGADYRAEGLDVSADGRARFTLVAPQGRAPVMLGVRGLHQAGNALAAAAAVLGGGITDDVERVAAALSAALPLSRWRMEVAERRDGVTVVNDAYNANPESMRAALQTLQVLGDGRSRRTWAVLGVMAELGPAAAEAHRELGRHAVRLGVDHLVAVGPDAGGIHAGAVLEGSWGQESVHVPDIEAAAALLHEQLRPGDVVLVKASRAAGLERLAEALLAGDR